MTIENLKEAIRRKMAYRFPKYRVRFESIEGEPTMLGVGVFAVFATEFKAVQDFVFDIESELSSNGTLPDEWELLPLVRDVETTYIHYPDLATPATASFLLLTQMLSSKSHLDDAYLPRCTHGTTTESNTPDLSIALAALSDMPKPQLKNKQPISYVSGDILGTAA